MQMRITNKKILSVRPRAWESNKKGMQGVCVQVRSGRQATGKRPGRAMSTTPHKDRLMGLKWINDSAEWNASKYEVLVMMP